MSLERKIKNVPIPILSTQELQDYYMTGRRKMLQVAKKEVSWSMSGLEYYDTVVEYIYAYMNGKRNHEHTIQDTFLHGKA